MENDVKLLVIVNMNKICRFCLRSDGAMTSLFDEESDTLVASQLSSFVPIKIEPDDNFPSKICHRCRYMIESCSTFKSMVLQSHKTLSESSMGAEGDNDDDDNEVVLNIKEEAMMLEEEAKDNLFYKTFFLEEEEEEENAYGGEVGEMSVDEAAQAARALDMVEEPKPNEAKEAKKFAKTPVDAPKKKNRECLLCCEPFDDEEALRAHVDAHVAGTDLEPYYDLGESGISCAHCGDLFTYRFNFLAHQRELLDLRPFACKYEGCTRTFHSKAALRHHVPYHAERNFICSVCAVAFKRKSDLRCHEIIHEDAGATYECPLCSYKCKNRLTKASHMKKHHRKKTFKCSSCPKEFFHSSELQRHEYIHQPEKRFRCDQCTFAYYSQSALSRHLRSHHAADPMEGTSGGGDGGTTDGCKKCDLCWQEHAEVPAEVAAAHFKDTLCKDFPYRCVNCGSGYWEETCLQKHSELCFGKLVTEIIDEVTDTPLPDHFMQLPP